MKVAICNVQEFNPTIGGIERVSVSLAEELLRNNIEVIFISCRKSQYSQTYSLPSEQLFLPDSYDYSKQNVNTLVSILTEKKIDILLNQNAHSELFNKTCYEAKVVTGVKLISVLHFSPDIRLKGNRNIVSFKFLSFFENFKNIIREMFTYFPLQYITMYDQCRLFKNLYKNSDRVVLLSEGFKKAYIKFAGILESSKLISINNMLSFPYQNKKYKKKKQILWCGRLLFSQKRPDRILFIWEKLQDYLNDWNLVIIGDGPFKKQMIELSNNLALKRVDFAGFTNPQKYYEESSILCLTSNHEGWGLVLTEAMQFGCIPIAFDSFESVHDIIDDGKNGFLVKPFDLDMYADKIKILSDNIDLDKVVLDTVNSVYKFTPEIIVKEWINLFENIKYSK